MSLILVNIVMYQKQENVEYQAGSLKERVQLSCQEALKKKINKPFLKEGNIAKGSWSLLKISCECVA